MVKGGRAYSCQKHLEPRSIKRSLDTTNAHASMRCELADNLFPAYYKIRIRGSCIKRMLSIHDISLSSIYF